MSKHSLPTVYQDMSPKECTHLHGFGLQVPAIETVEKGGISNQIEATLVHAVVSLLLKVRSWNVT